jgi:hypothetical protein
MVVTALRGKNQTLLSHEELEAIWTWDQIASHYTSRRESRREKPMKDEVKIERCVVTRDENRENAA